MKTIQHRFKTLALSLATAGLLSAGMASMALAGSGPEHRMDRMAERLQLSDEQRGAMAALMDIHREEMREIEWRTDDGERNPEARQAAREARLALRQEMESILTAEQLEKLQGMKKGAGHKHGRGHHSGKRGGQGMARQLRGLDLSEEQEDVIRELVREHRKNSDTGYQELRADIRNVLTEDQRAQLDARREQHKSRSEQSERPQRDRMNRHRSS